jgi:hypothetical protein
MRRLMRIVLWIVGVLVVGIAVLFFVLRHSPTATTAGPEAETLARQMVRSVDDEAWARTGAVRWRLPGRHHLWDRQRGLARVEWRHNRVLLDTGSKKGRAWTNDVEVTDGAAKQKLLDKAYALFINDSFWLNPVVKAFDDGTSRARGTVDGKPAVAVAYSSGGLTPGDKYLWILGDDGRPIAWRVWVHILPVGGLQFSWEGWTKLATGAWIATSHKALGIDLVPIKDAVAATTLRELEPSDPFALIL